MESKQSGSLVDIRTMLERLGIPGEKRHDRWWAPCPHPEHDDGTASWFIEDCPTDEAEHGHHFCFGCKRGGWPVQLVKWVVGVPGKEAWEWLVSTEQHAPAQLKVQMQFGPVSSKFELPEGVTFEPLYKWPLPPRRYAEHRNLAAEDVRAWRIGYALTGRLYGRLVFPVYGLSGKLLSYTARTFEKHHLKYLEPKKSEGANLGAVFGEMLWPADRSVVVVTEGALDGLAVWHHTGLPVAGLYGSQLHPGQLARIASFKSVIIATDNDKAGNLVFAELAAQLARHCRLARAHMPKGEDCASLGNRLPEVIKSVEWFTGAPRISE